MANYKEKQKDNFKSNGASKSPEIRTLKGETGHRKNIEKAMGVREIKEKMKEQGQQTKTDVERTRKKRQR